ncbi:M23 family metallopeptidase [Cellulomonas edaphi]|uniref:Peptidoglycan DD-metalloendopeptidase family protein n=1 Tax=Cellulomonas edaphi TaxID=3053468 RepID=A0ABT7SCH5_9CELL|nr:peptidoglycan DD-metalloendopeptidase family protein [Cellulomons edaphi]MDM7832702.1 peptidoglycan DD-metalloendopeptidase family protein [Cellulomons edaphi]
MAHTRAPFPRRRLAQLVAVLALCSVFAALLAPAVARASADGFRPGVASPSAAAASHGFTLPLPGRAHVVRAFEPPPAPWVAGHRGVDLAAVVGADVLAPGDGVVTFAGRVAGRPLVSIAHPGGLRSSVEPVAPDVAAGDRVRVGEAIGSLAPRAWHCVAACLHWGVRSGRGSPPRYVDPMALLGRAGPIVLLPGPVPRG